MIKAETIGTGVSISIDGDGETIQREFLAVVTTITETLIEEENMSPEAATDAIKKILPSRNVLCDTPVKTENKIKKSSGVAPPEPGPSGPLEKISLHKYNTREPESQAFSGYVPLYF